MMGDTYFLSSVPCRINDSGNSPVIGRSVFGIWMAGISSDFRPHSMDVRLEIGIWGKVSRLWVNEGVCSIHSPQIFDYFEITAF